MKKNKKAFTLVELIVVLIIIVILGTIAYYSLQGHNKDARNSIRLSALSSFEEQLELYSVKTGGLPIPEDYVEIYSSGVLIGYQGYLGERILGLLNIKGGKDPLDEEYYTYMVDTKRRNFEIMAFLEESEMIFNIPKNIYADNSKRIPSVKGKKLGIIVNQTNDPIQKLITGSFDIANTNDIYKSYLNNETIITGTGIELRKASPTYSCERIFELSKKTITGNYNIDNHYSTGSSTLNVNCDLDLDGLTPLVKNIEGLLNDSINSIKVDSEGYIYIGGHFASLTLNFFGQTINNTGSSGTDYFLAKLDNNLKLIWLKNGGSTSNDLIQNIELDLEGNIYVGGYFSGTNTNIFGNTISSGTLYDYFIVKLDNDGNSLWIKNGGGSGSDYISSIQLDSEGNIYVGGNFNSSNANILGNTISTTGTSYDYFLAKLDNNGNCIWIKNGGGLGGDYISLIELDSEGNIYVGGNFNSSNANILGNTISTTGTSIDYFLVKLNNNGNSLWIKNGGGSGSDYISSIQLDSEGNIYVGGNFNSSNANILGNNISTTGTSTDYFLIKLDNNGNSLWIKNGGSLGDDSIINTVLDIEGNIYIGGFFSNIKTNILGKNISSNGGTDYFISKLDNNGNLIWIKSGGGLINERTRDIIINNDGNIYITGITSSTLGADIFGKVISSIGGNDSFLIKLFK